MSDKKIVVFGEALHTPEIGKMAILFDVRGHYRLGDVDHVYTSYVVDVRDDGNTIETKNTIYKKQGEPIER